jgi:predicted dinucleotide-utilizing enzyme
MSSFGYRDDLITRVERLVAREGVERASIEAVVDRVVAALPEPRASVMVAVSAVDLPDLASRLRKTLPPALRDVPLASARQGRHTVVCCSVSGEGAQAMAEAARRLGARVDTHGPA